MTSRHEANTPQITEALRAHARRNPGRWVYAIDPEVDPDGEVQPAAISGAWRVTDEGEISGDFVPNERYRPSPTALGWPTARSKLERAIQLFRSDLAASAFVTHALERAELLVVVNEDGTPHLDTPEDGRERASAFTSRDYAGERRTAAVRGADLPRLVGPGVRIDIDPDRRSSWSIGEVA